jgi:hypothetical protein
MTDPDWEAFSTDLHRRFPTDDDLVQEASLSLWEALRLGKPVPNPKASGDDVYTHPGLLDDEIEPATPPKAKPARRRRKQVLAVA